MTDDQMMRVRLAPGLICWLAAGAILMTAPPASAQVGTPLYACGSDARAEVEPIGLVLCDADPTDTLTARADDDNLQIRRGAVVVSLAPDGIADTAGLHAGDMIYRVGGVNVETADAATASLARIEQSSDTVVNFLRGGRPYRVKLRQP